MYTSKKLSWLGVIALGAVLLTACAPGSSQAQEPSTPEPQLDTATAAPTEDAPSGAATGLANTSWKLTEIDGVSVPAESTANIIFAENEVTGTGSCNGFGGGYTVEGSNITFSEIISTLMMCDEPTMQIESPFMSVLQDKATFVQSSDSLVITGANGTKLTFAPQ